MRVFASCSRHLALLVLAYTFQSGGFESGNFAPALLSLSVRAYDQKKGGKQTLPMVLIPEGVVNATLESKDTVERSVAGKDLKLTRYHLALASIEITVWRDTRSR